MAHNFDSIAEAQAASRIAELGGYPTQTFKPHLEETFADAGGAVRRAKPDFVIERPGCFTFVDTKDGVLHDHYTFASSDEAQRDAYRLHFHRSGDHLTHWDRSDALFYDTRSRRGKPLALKTGWNHSLYKLAAVQAKHGWQRFLVVFESAPSKANAKRYIAAGLVFCTVKTLPDLMNTIELLQHGWHVPFVFKGPGYSFTVKADQADSGLTPDAVEASDRAKFLAAVAADREAIAAQKAQWAADEAAGIFPF
jgi:hypothetical protein